MILLKNIDWSQASKTDKQTALARPLSSRQQNVTQTVADILNRVRTEGDVALLEYTKRFDKAELKNLKVTNDEIEQAFAETSEDLKQSLREAIRSIRLFHRAQVTANIKIETSPGVVCEKRSLPLQKVGLYIPGGTAPLPSTLMMLAIPAQEAKCPEIILTTPPNAQGKIHPVILTAAKLLGLENIYKCGGAQAIGALAYGTQTVPQVHKIFGPGNAWVTEAKMQVGFDPRGAAIDLPAGPSEVLVVADESANAQFIAADLLSQAEHDISSQVILVSTSQTLIDQVNGELVKQLETLSRRSTAQEALASSRSILVNTVKEAMEVSNLYAPEHLIIQTQNARQLADLVQHAGSVFIGPWSPESVGDYASGTNHVLPTYGFARAFSGVGLESFTKAISFQELSAEGLQFLGPHVEKLSSAEGLDAHCRAVTYRLAEIQKSGKS